MGTELCRCTGKERISVIISSLAWTGRVWKEENSHLIEDYCKWYMGWIMSHRQVHQGMGLARCELQGGI